MKRKKAIQPVVQITNLGVALLVSMLFLTGHLVHGQVQINNDSLHIPAAVRVTRDGRQPLPPVERFFYLNELDVHDENNVFDAPPCLEGQYYVGFQLHYDLGDMNTTQMWDCSLDLSLLHGEDTLWTRPVTIGMKEQTFASTIFHDSLIACDGDYRFYIKSKQTEAGLSPAPEPNILLRILLYKQPDVVFDPADLVELHCTYASGTAEVNWTYEGEAEAYDVEWVFIEAHEGTDVDHAIEAFSFKEPVRVTVATPGYSHLTYYPYGRLWYRVRAIGYDPQYPDHRIIGQWAYSSPDAGITVSNHQPDKNWQLHTVFAEEGKYKKIMQYFDGSMLQRQSQTNLSHDTTTLVGETLYDFEGRKSVDILAVPVMQTSLNYRPAFNVFESSQQLVADHTSSTRHKFHYDNRRILNSTIADTSGAGQYYSNKNNTNSVHKDLIPHAEGYVYSQTEYLNDGTGRVARQSGVGKEFSSDGDHATRYYYAGATRNELTRLFGSNVGHASHYKKNLVVDPNGQVSVSYLDQEGRVIATALAGDSPANVEALESYTSLDLSPVTENLSDKNHLEDGISIMRHHFLNVSPDAEYSFQYNLSALASDMEGAGCQSCTFDLIITLTDPEGSLVELPDAIPGNQATDNFHYRRMNITTADCDSALVINDIAFDVSLADIGDYTITKRLIPHELLFGEMKTVLEQDSATQVLMQQIRDSYVADPAECEICTETCDEAESYIEEAIDEIAALDCENILRQIEQYYADQNEPAPDLTAHPLYCKYLLCVKNQESDAFDKRQVRVQSWSAAVTGGKNNPVNQDPFFNNVALSGYNYKGDLQDKLNNISLGTIGSTTYTGTILQVTDPENTSFYVNTDGAHDVNGKHILYLDLMSRRSELGETVYAVELDKQRWVMYRSMYEEAKRQVKLSIIEYQACPSAMEELQPYSDLASYEEEDVKQWGNANGLKDSVSVAELEMSLYSITNACNATLSSPDSASVMNHLKAYFDSNPQNLLRMIHTEDLASDANLSAINGVLSGYNCALDSVALVNMMSCVRDTTITIPENILYPNQGQELQSAAVSPERLSSVSGKSDAISGVRKGDQEIDDQKRIHLKKAKAIPDSIAAGMSHNIDSDIASRILRKVRVSQKSFTAASVNKSTQVSLMSAGLPDQTEYDALIALYHATNDLTDTAGIYWYERTDWINQTGWKDADPNVIEDVSGWHGVMTDGDGHVVGLNLANNRLKGILPSQTGDLIHLSILNLSSNQLEGNMPGAMDNLSSLYNLNLSANKFQGDINVLGSLSGLILLNLSFNEFQGDISAVVNHPSLMILDLRNNQFQGNLPVSLGNLLSLWELSLSNNQMTVDLDILSGLSSLEVLQMEFNDIGSIPGSIGNLTNLRILNLSGGQITGSIPLELSNLSRLEHLGLEDNQLTGSIPSLLGDLANLYLLDISDNQLSGEIPVSLGESNLAYLSLDHNHLTGSIPSGFEGLLALDLSDNQLSGGIPTSLGSSNLDYLNLSDNLLTGGIPGSLGNTNLRYLYLNDNQLTGGIPSTFAETSLSYLDLSTNLLTGTIPASLGDISGLYSLNLSNNQLTGSIPSSLETLANLWLIDLSHNNLSGGIPVFSGDVNLNYLRLADNQLAGSIPSSFGNLANLLLADLSLNQLSGEIPAFNGNPSLRYLYLNNNDLTGSVPEGLGNLSLVEFFIGNNDLSGNFPGLILRSDITIGSCENNKFTFSDLLPVFSQYYNSVENAYSSVPQDSVDIKRHFTLSDQPVTFTTSIDRNLSPKCMYQWFKFVDGTNDIALTPRDTASHTFTIVSPTLTDSGRYYYTITNESVSGDTDLAQLMLVSRFQLVDAAGFKSFALCLQYDSTNTTLQSFTYKVNINDLIQQCMERAAKEDTILTEYAINRLMQEKATSFYNEFMIKCMQGVTENLQYSYIPKEYHYTLYYYDQSANLVQTVPPSGVYPLTGAQVENFLSVMVEPSHTLRTRYQYNSLNQLIWQSTPDAGESQFWYNDKGQLRLSQNAQQRVDTLYSYTKYDEQGRIVEVGELGTDSELGDLIAGADSLHWPMMDRYMLTDITRTHYDLPASALKQAGFPQSNLRTRVSWVEVIDKNATDTTATYYSYDIHGNVKSLQQNIPGLDAKRTDYVYDLVSGKVNYVMYQFDRPDQFIHRYDYDSDNRITSVFTSTDGFIWDQDASYRYYAHGPLARVELGEYRVQGLDYYYTLQGWIKGVNMPYAGDPGGDGITSISGKDVFAYSLGYYNQDYKAVNNSVTLADSRDQLWPRLNDVHGHSGLYNGNISWMVTDLSAVASAQADRTKGMQAMVYKYDQLHRITKSRSLTEYNAVNGFAPRTLSPAAYDEDYSYDPNGNLLTLDRKNHLGSTLHDFDYGYYPNTNKLRQVGPPEDMVYSGALSSNTKLYRKITVQDNAYVPQNKPVELRALEEIEMDPDFEAEDGADFWAHIVADSGMYQYDKIGNLILDQHEGVKISWTPYGKVREVRSKSDSLITTFRYDGSGNRIEKKVARKDSVDIIHITQYVRDASGNVMAVYKDSLATEQYVYGSSRLGLYGGGRYYGQQSLGERQYELSNHLGNVLAVVTDNIGMNTADSVWASVVSTRDYYPFGLEMQGRIWSDSTLIYRYGFNGKEKDDTEEWGNTAYDYGFRIYNPSIGKFLSVDPLAKEFPWNGSYAFAENQVISCIDLEGLEKYRVVGRSFAPRGSFEGTHFESKADDRTKFQIADYRKVSARIHVQIGVDLDKWVVSRDIYSQNTILKGGSSWEIDNQEINVAGYGSRTNKQMTIKGDYYAKNGTEIGPSIDIQLALDISRDSRSNTLTVRTNLTGNIFPAQETILFDEHGTGLFLGTSTAQGGPLSGVWGNGKDNVLSSELMQVQTDESGNFLGVYGTDENGNEIVMSPDAYNNKFTDKKVWNSQDGRSDY